eukprot:365629-Chlamydomonas_euryale.AAC.3
MTKQRFDRPARTCSRRAVKSVSCTRPPDPGRCPGRCRARRSYGHHAGKRRPRPRASRACRYRWAGPQAVTKPNESSCSCMANLLHEASRRVEAAAVAAVGSTIAAVGSTRARDVAPACLIKCL